MRKKKVSPETIAAWMVDEFKRQGGVLYQSDAAAKIEELFGEQLFRLEGGIDPKVLKAFQKLTGNSVVWINGERYWRRRRRGDKPGRLQTSDSLEFPLVLPKLRF